MKSNSNIAASAVLETENDCPINPGTEFAIVSRSGSPGFENIVVKSVHSKGKKMSGDAYRAVKASQLFYNAAKSFID